MGSSYRHGEAARTAELDAVQKAAAALRAQKREVDRARAILRQRIEEAARADESRSAIARAAGVSRQWIARLLEC